MTVGVAPRARGLIHLGPFGLKRIVLMHSNIEWMSKCSIPPFAPAHTGWNRNSITERLSDIHKSRTS